MHEASQARHPTTDVLLVTATEVEARAVLEMFPGYRRSFIGNKTYYDLGRIGETSVVMVQSEMGAGGQGGASSTVSEGIQALAPTAVVMVGIAFGFPSDERSIGDILVATQVADCNLLKVGTGANSQVKMLSRGDRVGTSGWLVDRFRAGVKDWLGEPKIHFGLVLSKNDLIDNLDYRNQLLQLEPEAIGGEMEGAGLYVAAQGHKVDWILVKAICDWADGSKADNKSVYQQLAADNVTRFTLHTIQQGGLKRDTSTSPVPPKASVISYEGHSNYVVTIAWEPRGNRIVSAGGDGTARVWNADTAEHLLTYRGHSPTGIRAKTTWATTIYNVAWSPDGKRIASAGDGKTVNVWDASTGGTLQTYKEHSGFLPNVFALAWSPDGSRIASACSSASMDKTVHVWNVKTGKTVLRYDAHAGFSPNFSVSALAWSPDGSRIASTCDDKTIRIWNADTGDNIARCHVHADWVSDIAWSPDSTLIAAAYTDSTAQIWDAVSGNIVLTYSGHTDSVRSVAWSPDGTLIVSASNDKTAQVWDSATGNHIFTYKGHTNLVTSVAWSPDGKRIASASNDKTVKVWSVNQAI